MEQLMTKSVWSAKDLLRYATLTYQRMTTRKAYRIIEIARQRYGGETALKKTYATRDSVLAIFNTTAERELDIWQKARQSDSSQEKNG